MPAHAIAVALSTLLATLVISANAHAQSPEAPAVADAASVLDAFAHEPDVNAVQAAALRYVGLDQDDLDRWSGRARWSHIVPRVQGQIAWLDQHDLRHRFRENLTSGDDGRLQHDYTQNYIIDDLRLRTIYTLRLSWDLQGLVYDRTEVAIAREVRGQRQERSALLSQVTDLYFDRRHRQALQRLGSGDPWEVRLERELEIQALTARLDALTGGWFSRQLPPQADGGAR